MPAFPYPLLYSWLSLELISLSNILVVSLSELYMILILYLIRLYIILFIYLGRGFLVLLHLQNSILVSWRLHFQALSTGMVFRFVIYPSGELFIYLFYFLGLAIPLWPLIYLLLFLFGLVLLRNLGMLLLVWRIPIFLLWLWGCFIETSRAPWQYAPYVLLSFLRILVRHICRLW